MRGLTMLFALAMIVTSCSSSSELDVEDAWARNSAGMADAGAVYMTITGGEEADRLTGVTIGSNIAGMAQVHETAMDDDGLMSMQEVPQIDIPANGEVSLEPGGFHVMIMPLADPLTAGDEFTITLNFEQAGPVEVTVEVREE